MSDELYRARILDHAKTPRNRGVMQDATIEERGSNPTCGDRLTLYLKVEGDTIAAASFAGEGCAISTAAASLLTERLQGLPVTDAQVLGEQDIYDMLGVAVGPGREKCALLAWRALQAGLREFTVPGS